MNMTSYWPHKLEGQNLAPTAWIHGPNLPRVDSPGWWRWSNAVGNVFWRLFTLSLLVLNCNCLFEYCCWPCDHLLIPTFSTNAQCHKAKLISNRLPPTWQWVHFSLVAHPSPIEQIWNVIEEIHSKKNLHELHGAVRTDQNLKGMFPASCGFHATKN